MFLTATPLQLQRHELFSLVEMLNPVLFASEGDFIRHVQELSGLNKLLEEIRSEGLPAEITERCNSLARRTIGRLTKPRDR